MKAFLFCRKLGKAFLFSMGLLMLFLSSNNSSNNGNVYTYNTNKANNTNKKAPNNAIFQQAFSSMISCGLHTFIPRCSFIDASSLIHSVTSRKEATSTNRAIFSCMSLAFLYLNSHREHRTQHLPFSNERKKQPLLQLFVTRKSREKSFTGFSRVVQVVDEAERHENEDTSDETTISPSEDKQKRRNVKKTAPTSRKEGAVNARCRYTTHKASIGSDLNGKKTDCSSVNGVISAAISNLDEEEGVAPIICQDEAEDSVEKPFGGMPINSGCQEDEISSSNTRKDRHHEWNFMDVSRISISSGKGGNGATSFLRGKHLPFGGPDGGHGGMGGSIYAVCDPNSNTLRSVRRKRHWRAGNGGNGGSRNKRGSKGDDCYIPFPPGTILRDDSNTLISELLDESEPILLAKGGRGGRGNSAFKTSGNRSPRNFELGGPAKEFWLDCQLKIVADVGLVGLPNAGKSSLLAAVSNTRPKIASYQFTTLVPNVGVCDENEVVVAGKGKGLVISDVPGLIEGAHQGLGLGYSFLKHIERCRIIIHLIDGSSKDPLKDYQTVLKELRSYSSVLSAIPDVVVINKVDLPEVQDQLQVLYKQFEDAVHHRRILSISALEGTRCKELMLRSRYLLNKMEKKPPDNASNSSTQMTQCDEDDA